MRGKDPVVADVTLETEIRILIGDHQDIIVSIHMRIMAGRTLYFALIIQCNREDGLVLQLSSGCNQGRIINE